VGIELEKTRRDVTITAVRPGTPADEAEILPGDFLLAVNGTMVTSATRASQLIGAARDVVILTTRSLPDAVSVWLEKSAHDGAVDVEFAWDSKVKEVRVVHVGDSITNLLEVGDLLIAVHGVRLDRVPSSVTRAREMVKLAPAGLLSLRILRLGTETTGRSVLSPIQSSHQKLGVI